MRIFIDVINTLRIERTHAPLDSVDLVSLQKKEFRKIRTVLSGYAGY
jgi:hypothetical protein